MKREYTDGGGVGKMAAPPPDAGMDEHLAALGYKVRSSDMADVAQKLEQLEMAMVGGSGGAASAPDDNAILTHLASETIHYNPSDLSSWLETMLSELNAPAIDPPSDNLSSIISAVDLPESSSDLQAIPGRVLYGEPDSRDRKRQRTSPESPVHVVLVDSQETGIRLVHTLMACAEAVQQENLPAAEALVKQIGVLTMSQGGAMRKVAAFFAEALARRIYVIPVETHFYEDVLEMNFYECCPYLKFAHFTANQAILEAFAGKEKVHVIDFSIKQGQQWPALMQALALRPGGPPSFKLTGVCLKKESAEALQQVGGKLAQLAESMRVEFNYQNLVIDSPVDLKPFEDEEVLAVNAILELHKLLASPGEMEKTLAAVQSLKPQIVTVVEQEANHNGEFFAERFNEALHYYSTMFDSLEGSGAAEMQVMTEVYLGRQICNIVACEGGDRVERHETAAQWKGRMLSAGFEPVAIGSNAFKQASMLLTLFGSSDGFRVEEREGCLMLGWHTRPLITTSAWRLAGGAAVD